MRLRSSVILAAAGAAALWYGSQRINNEFSAESVFQRTRPQIERSMRADPATQERMIDGLRGSLLGAKDDTERCKIELLAVATAHSRGDQAAAQKEIERRSLKPYSECEPENREAKSKNIWYKYGGFAAIGIALISLVFTVIDYARQKVGEARRERSTRAAESRRRREEDEGDGAADPMDAYPDPRTRAGPDDG